MVISLVKTLSVFFGKYLKLTYIFIQFSLLKRTHTPAINKAINYKVIHLIFHSRVRLSAPYSLDTQSLCYIGTRKYLNNMQQSDLIHSQTGNGLRHASSSSYSPCYINTNHHHHQLNAEKNLRFFISYLLEHHLWVKPCM